MSPLLLLPPRFCESFRPLFRRLFCRRRPPIHRAHCNHPGAQRRKPAGRRQRRQRAHGMADKNHRRGNGVLNQSRNGGDIIVQRHRRARQIAFSVSRHVGRIHRASRLQRRNLPMPTFQPQSHAVQQHHRRAFAAPVIRDSRLFAARQRRPSLSFFRFHCLQFPSQSGGFHFLQRKH